MDIVHKLSVVLFATACVLGARDFGPPVGSRLPVFTLPDQSGRLHSARGLAGAKGVVILFYHSPDSSKAQLEELDQHQDAFHKLGLNVAALSNDSVAVLKSFSAQAALHFPLLSDSGSKVIRSLNLADENAPQGSPARTGWLVVDASGAVTAKYFESDPGQAYTSAAILMHRFGWTPPDPPRKVEGKQIVATMEASNATVAPGQRVALTIDVDLQPNLHVYAPGVETYIPIEWKMDDGSAAEAHDTVFPHAEKLFLKAINETVPTYTNHFRLSRDITIPPDEKLKAALDGEGHFVVNSTLKYQACDDRMCYFPQMVKLKWEFQYTGAAKP